MSNKQVFYELLSYQDGEFISEEILDDTNHERPAGFVGAIRTTIVEDSNRNVAVKLLGFPPETYLRAEQPINEAIYVQDNNEERVVFPKSRMEELETLARPYNGPIKLEHYHVSTAGTEKLYSLPHFSSMQSGKHFVVKDADGEIIEDVCGVGLQKPKISVADGRWKVEKPEVDAVYLLAEVKDGLVAGSTNVFDDIERTLPGGLVRRGESITEALVRASAESGWEVPNVGLKEIGTIKSGPVDVMYVAMERGSPTAIDNGSMSGQPKRASLLDQDELPVFCKELLAQGHQANVRIEVGDGPVFVQQRDVNNGQIDTFVCRDQQMVNDISENRGLNRDGFRYTLVDIDSSMVSMHHGRSIIQLPYAVPGVDEAAHFVELNNAKQIVDFHKGTGSDAPRFTRMNLEEYKFTTERKERELANLRGEEFDDSSLPNLVQSPDRPDLRVGKHYFILQDEMADDERPLKLHKDTESAVEAIGIVRAGREEGLKFKIATHEISESQVEIQRNVYELRYNSFLAAKEFNSEDVDLPVEPKKSQLHEMC